MEPVTTVIAAALLAGAASGTAIAAEKAIVDAYEGLKALILRKFGENTKLVQAIENLENEPDFDPNRDALERRIQDAGADKDPEVSQAAERLVEELKKYSEVVKSTGVDMEKVEAASIRIREVAASGTGVRMRGIKATGDIDISGVRAGDTDPKAGTPE
jgi:hypothetical protein